MATVLDVGSEVIDRLYKRSHLKAEEIDLELHPNQYVTLVNLQHRVPCKADKEAKTLLPLNRKLEAKDIKPRRGNEEQLMLLDALMDDDIPVVVVTGCAGTGKAQPMHSKVLTPTGWKVMADISPGDMIVGRHGNPVKVLSVHPQGVKDIYRVIFSDGSSAECCEDHLWYTRTQRDRDCHRDGSVKSLKEISQSLRVGVCDKRNHSIPMVEPVNFQPQEVPLDGYVLGCLIGDGSLSIPGRVYFTCADEFIVNEMETRLAHNSRIKKNACSPIEYRINRIDRSKLNGVVDAISGMGLGGTKSDQKFVPSLYLFNTVDVRVAVLQGLMDTDGTVSRNGTDVSFCTTSNQLAKDVQFLVNSLGGKATIGGKQTYYTYLGVKRAGKPSFVVHMSLPPHINPFRLPRKKNLVVPKSKYLPNRYVDAVEYVGKMPAQCIYIDDPEHLYVTDDFIVTHNTLITLASALQKVEDGKYDRIIITKPIVQIGEDFGILPGEVKDKFLPYLGNYTSNLEEIYGQQVSDPTLVGMEMVPIQFIRGVSWANKFVIADEIQSLSHHEILTLGTRVGKGTKLVLMGDIKQRDRDIEVEATGLHHLIASAKFQNSNLTAVVNLTKVERSPVTQLFTEVFE